MLKEKGLSEGQWPQLTREGPVINVQRQSRTLQQKQGGKKNLDSVAISQHDWEKVHCGMCLCMCAQMCVPRNSIVLKKVCVRVCFKTHMGDGVKALQLSYGCGK